MVDKRSEALECRTRVWYHRIALFVVATMIWLGTSFGAVRVGDGATWELWLGTGGIHFTCGPEPDGRCLRGIPYERGLGVRTFCPVPWFHPWTNGGQRAVYIPSWPILLPVIYYGTAVILRVRARRKHSICSNCGYDLTANVTETCPECGSRVDAPASRAGRSARGCSRWNSTAPSDSDRGQVVRSGYSSDTTTIICRQYCCDGEEPQ